MKVWIVDSGAYEGNYIDRVFISEVLADAYAKQRNDAAAAKAAIRGYRPMDDCWDVTDYEVEEELEVNG